MPHGKGKKYKRTYQSRGRKTTQFGVHLEEPLASFIRDEAEREGISYGAACAKFIEAGRIVHFITDMVGAAAEKRGRKAAEEEIDKVFG